MAPDPNRFKTKNKALGFVLVVVVILLFGLSFFRMQTGH